MESILPTETYTEVEGRQYLNPQVALDESNRFIDNLRSTQAQQNQQIATDTYNLGTALPSAQGGLGTNTPVGLSYFTSRLQTPQTASAVANLRAAAQAAALNQALENEQAIWKKRYQDAYRKYQKSAYDKANTPQNPYATPEGEETEYETTDQVVGSVESLFSPAGSGDFVFTPSNIGGGDLGTGGVLNGGNTLTPAGSVNIVRNKGGGIESLTYNGKTYTGDAAKKRYDFLLDNGSITRAEN